MKEAHIPGTSQIVVNGETVSYHGVPADFPGSMLVAVKDPKDFVQVDTELQRRLLDRYWFLAPEYRQGPTERFEIGLAVGANVDVFNFQERGLSEVELERLGGMLAKFYHSLVDKDAWNLESVQIHGQDQHNIKSGQFMRGQEVPSQRRFILFPVAFGDGKYRGEIDTSWLEGTTAHETTHVVLEQTLAQLWNDNAIDLGWRTTYDTQIILPGGFNTFWYNEFPSRIPTEYGTYQQDDDRAESVVQFLTNQARLDASRLSVLSKVLMPNVDVPPPTIRFFQPELPKPPITPVTIMPRGKLLFSISERGEAKAPPPTIPLVEFRKKHGIISNH